MPLPSHPWTPMTCSWPSLYLEFIHYQFISPISVSFQRSIMTKGSHCPAQTLGSLAAPYAPNSFCGFCVVVSPRGCYPFLFLPLHLFSSNTSRMLSLVSVFVHSIYFFHNVTSMWPALESPKLKPALVWNVPLRDLSLLNWFHGDLAAVSCACFNLDSLDNELPVVRDSRSCYFAALVVFNKAFST